jgi:hypothetical protein
MKGYFIEGEPVLGEGESGRAALARNKARLRAVDRLGANRRQLGQRRDPPAHPRAHPRLARGDRRQYGTRMVPALTAYRSLTTGPSKAAPLLPVM